MWDEAREDDTAVSHNPSDQDMGAQTWVSLLQAFVGGRGHVCISQLLATQSDQDMGRDEYARATGNGQGKRTWRHVKPWDHDVRMQGDAHTIGRDIEQG